MKDKINITIFITIIFSLFAIFLGYHNKEYSIGERRKLKQISSLNEVFNKENFDDFLLDQFPFRDNFIKLHSLSNFYIFRKIENDNILLKNNYAIRKTDNYNYEAVEKTCEKIETVIKKLKIRNGKLIVIPEKSYFLNEYNYHYEKILSILNKNLNIDIIDTSPKLTLDSYYKTDSHWSQDKILNVKNYILDNLNIDKKETSYELKEIPDFYGVYSSQSGLGNEFIKYLTNKNIESLKVYNYETKKYTKVYDLEKLENKNTLDKYDVFLSGANALLRIDNPNVNNKKTLYVFRDSFSSSFIPLFTEYYNTIYLIDLRYITLSNLERYINVNKDDEVWFVYSTLILETPENFKTN